MRSVMSLVAAGAASLLSSMAFAADMAIAPPPMYAPPPVQEFGGWYLRGDIGMTNQSMKSLNNPDPNAVLFNQVGMGFDIVDAVGPRRRLSGQQLVPRRRHRTIARPCQLPRHSIHRRRISTPLLSTTIRAASPSWSSSSTAMSISDLVVRHAVYRRRRRTSYNRIPVSATMASAIPSAWPARSASPMLPKRQVEVAWACTQVSATRSRRT